MTDSRQAGLERGEAVERGDAVERGEAVERGDKDAPRSEGSQRPSTAQLAAVRRAAGSEEARSGPATRTPVGPGSKDADADQDATPLFDKGATDKYRDRWKAIQSDFVDDPRQAVKRADEMVAELIQELAKSFAQERSKLEGQWDRGGDVSTEDMRIALRRYRSFFGRLLSV